MGVIIPITEIAKASILRVEALEGPAVTSLREKCFEMNACGMVGSRRGKNDGCTIIGTTGGIDDNETTVPLNDFEIGYDLEGSKRHMIIKYSMFDRKYYLRDLGDGSGTFVRVDKPLTLKNGYIISFGDSHVSVNF
jgi:hypothetical protein